MKTRLAMLCSSLLLPLLLAGCGDAVGPQLRVAEREPAAAPAFGSAGSLLHASIADPGTNCPRSVGFWKNHPGVWGLSMLILGTDVFLADEAMALLHRPPRGDATVIAAHQLIATKLNIVAGADATTVQPAAGQLDAWLASVGGIGTTPRGALREEGIELAAMLDSFNNGLLGPAPCMPDP